MLWRVLLTAVTVSYLICVLVLSGMQKEDLDMGLLRKLHTHNVNIDDMNNETTRQECLYKIGRQNISKHNEDKEGNDKISMEIPYSTTNGSEIKDTDVTLALDATDMEGIIQYLNEKQITEETISTPKYHHKKVSTKRKHIHNDNITNDVKINHHKTTNNDKIKKEANKRSKIELDTGPLPPDVLTFLNMYTNDNREVNIKEHIVKNKNSENNPETDVAQEEKINKNAKTSYNLDFDNITSKDVANISRILSEIITGKEFVSTEKPPETTQIFNKNSVFQLLNRFLESNRHSNGKAQISNATPKHIEKTYSSYLENHNSGHKSTFLNMDNYLKNKIQITADEISNIPDKGEIKSEQETEPDNYGIEFYDSPPKINDTYINDVQSKTTHEMSQYENGQQMLKQVKRYYPMPKDSKYKISDTGEDWNKPLNPDVIKQIAERVKAIVLNDLREKLATTPTAGSSTKSTTVTKKSTTVTTTSTTTVIPSTTTTTSTTANTTIDTITTAVSRKPDPKKVQEATQVLQKFIELFEELKAIKEKTAVDNDTKINATTDVTHQPVTVEKRYPFLSVENPDAVTAYPHLSVTNTYASLYAAKPRQLMPAIKPHQSVSNLDLYVPLSAAKSYPSLPATNSYTPPSPEIRYPLLPEAKRFPPFYAVNLYPPQNAPTPYGKKHEQPAIIIDHRYHEPNIAMSPNSPMINQNQIIASPTLQRILATNGNQSHEPRLIQTNSNQIPPLGIPISRALPINLNLLLTTLPPYVKTREDYERWEYMSRYGRNPASEDDIRDRKEKLSAYSSHLGGINDHKEKLNAYSKTNLLSKGIKDLGSLQQHDANAIRFALKNRQGINSHSEERSSRMRERTISRFKKNYNKRNRDYSRDYRKEVGSVHGRLRPRNPYIRGFHERLERTDDWSRGSGGYEPNMKSKERQVEVISRQQVPLNEMHTASNYDDTHFRNFMKTQEKVNDMLERILATKTNSGIPSVETL